MAASDVVGIDPGGDVILACGIEDDTVRLRVSSVILSCASPVFKALLSPRFKEGTTLDTQRSVEIPLPDDNGRHMAIICNVLHHRNENVPETLESADILSVAILSDKYACMTAMKYMARIWIPPHLPTIPYTELIPLLRAAYYFNDSSLFEQACTYVVLRTPGPIALNTSACHIDPDLDVLKDAIQELNRQRTIALGNFIEFIESNIEFYANAIRLIVTCSCYRNIQIRIVDELISRGIWGSAKRDTMSIESLAEALNDSEKNRTMKERWRPCESTRCRDFMREAKARMDLGEEAKKLPSYITVPCFSCVRHGRKRLSDACEHRSVTVVGQ